MHHQQGFSELEHSNKRKLTRREKFLALMEEVVPWNELLQALKPFYPKGERGRPPIGLERMLRVYFLQQWYNLADEALEDALYDMPAFREFAGINLSSDPVPDATTVLKFRHLLEKHELCCSILETINHYLEANGLMMREGTMVDASIINAPVSTKNKDKSRDPEMSHAKKGNQYYFGMKVHIGVDRDSGMVHTVVSTTAKVADIVETVNLLHGQEEEVNADAGYLGVEKRKEIQEFDSEGEIKWNIAKRKSSVKKIEDPQEREAVRIEESKKASVRAFVEHPFHIIKNIFRYRKTRYRGIKKNHDQLQVLFALQNLVKHSRSMA